MLSDFRMSRSGVFSRAFGISALIAILFVVGCASGGNGPAQLSVTTVSSALPAGSVSAGGAYPSTALTASGGTAPYIWAVTSGTLPAGLSLGSSGTISGSPTAAGTFNFTVTVTDSATPTPHTSTSSLSITINAVLSVTTSGTLPTTGETGQTYSATLAHTGGVGPFTWSLPSGSTLPAGLNLAATGTISGTITAAANTYTFTAKVTDAQGNSVVSGNISIKVDVALVITPPTLHAGVVGVSYTLPAFTASGGSASGYTFAVATGSIAPLVLGASNGIVSGTPTTAGTLQFTVKVTDSLGYIATTGSLSITINPAITVSLGPASPITLDQTKSQLVTATVGNDPNSAGVTWSAVTGLGTLTGSTSTTVTYNAPAVVASASTATFTATSVTDPTKSATYTVNLVPPPSITTSSMAAGNVNGAYSSPVSMTGGIAPYSWAIQAGPTGISLGASTTSTVTVQGTPTVAGNNQTFTIKVTDAQGLIGTSSGLTITVYPALVITPPSLPVGAVGLSYTSPAYTASGGSSSGYTFAIASGSIAPLVLGAGNGIITGTPTTAGTLQFTVKVTDSVNNTVTTSSQSITINPAITVGLAPASPVTLDQGKTQLVTATVSNDPNSAGVTWSTVTGLGTLTGSTSTTTTYNAPVSVLSASTATFTATSVTDPTKSATYTVNLVPPPSITTSSMPAGNVNGAYTGTVTVSGGVSPYTWQILAAPAGLTLNGSTTSTVTVQGAPTVGGNGQTFTIKVTDAQGLPSTSSGLTIDVFSQLVLTPPSLPLPTGAVGLNYPTTVTFSASGGSGAGYTWSIVAANPLPPGLALSAASGTSTSITAGPPTTAGTYPFTVKLTDSVNNTATTSGLSITINPAINVTLSPVQPFALDQNTTQLITATVSNDPASAGVTWSAVTGLGSLTGSTTSTITYNAPASIASTSIATFTATSITDPSKSATFSVSLEPPPVIATPTFPDATLNSAYTPSPVTVTGGVAPFTWLGTTLPAGMSLSSSTTNVVNLIGTPTTAGAGQTVTIKVTDAKGLTNTVSSTISVVAPSCTTNCTISGTVTGPWVSGITVSISGGGSPVTTNSSGVYSFTGLAGGTYTITPALAGYTFSPSAPSVVASSAGTPPQDFTESAVQGTFSISGKVSYSGTGHGITYIYVIPGGCTGGCNRIAGTTLSSAPTSIGTPYTIRGLNPGFYTVNAEIDSVGSGGDNESNPAGASSAVSIVSPNNATNVNFGVNDRTPVAPTAPKIQGIAHASGSAFINYKQPRDNSNEEFATTYRIYYGTDAAATNLGFKTLAAGDSNNVYLFTGLTDGTPYFFKMTAVNAISESAASSIVSTTPGATSGNNTVSGTVTFPVSGSGANLYVGFFSDTNGVYYVKIANPTSGVAYSVSGIPTGLYQRFAILDTNANGIIDPGDLSNFGHNGPPSFNVSGSTSGNTIALTAPVATTFVSTSHQRTGSTDSYGVCLASLFGSKQPASLTLFSAPSTVGVPFDFLYDKNNCYNPVYDSTVSPLAGDTFVFQVTFTDGTTQNISTVLPASPVLNSFAQNLAMNTGLPNSINAPLLTWQAPAAPPAFYSYAVGLNQQGGSEFWNYFGGNNSNGIPSTQLSVLFNTDNSASPSATLTSGTYDWWVMVQDDNGNSAQIHSTYVVP